MRDRLHPSITGDPADLRAAPGERVPAFFVGEDTAYSGRVFREKFPMLRPGKLFGSAAGNGMGDWTVRIPEKRWSAICANPPEKGEMDTDNPSGF